MQKIKLLVSYKDKHKIIRSDIIIPMQTGRAIAGETFEEMIGDDTGENISVLNNRFCETTAIYWAWKNYEEIGNPDYIGFMHYRRHFLFDRADYKPDFMGLVKYNELSEDYLKNNLNDEKIKKQVEQYDVIIPNRIENKSVNGSKNNYELYKNSHNVDDLDKALSLLINKHPDYRIYVEEYKNSSYAYFLDMFIMKKDIFFEYCNWIFPILFDLRFLILPLTDSYQNRAIGFISERLTDIFFRKLYAEKYNIKELPVSFIENVEEEIINKNIENDKKIIPIVLAASNDYIPYLQVCLQSIKDNIKTENIYEIHILGRNITHQNKEILRNSLSDEKFIIKFHNTEKLISKFPVPHKLEHISVDTYARFFIPEILGCYDKCIYLDADVIVREDLSKLYDISLDGKTIGASICAVMSGWVNIDSKIKNYIDNEVKLSDEFKYFQAGVLLLNLEKMRANKDKENLIKLAGSKKWIFVDQDVLNVYYKDDVKYIEMNWNYEYEHGDMRKLQFKEMMPLNILQKYIKAKKRPFIIHFQGIIKPWYNPEEEYAEAWWYYARKSPFYELIISNMIDYKNQSQTKNIKLYKKYKFRFLKYKVLRNILWGNARKKCIIKKNIYKEKLVAVKKLMGINNK